MAYLWDLVGVCGSVWWFSSLSTAYLWDLAGVCGPVRWFSRCLQSAYEIWQVFVGHLDDSPRQYQVSTECLWDLAGVCGTPRWFTRCLQSAYEIWQVSFIHCLIIPFRQGSVEAPGDWGAAARSASGGGACLQADPGLWAAHLPLCDHGQCKEGPTHVGLGSWETTRCVPTPGWGVCPFSGTRMYWAQLHWLIFRALTVCWWSLGANAVLFQINGDLRFQTSHNLWHQIESTLCR